MQNLRVNKDTSALLNQDQINSTNKAISPSESLIGLQKAYLHVANVLILAKLNPRNYSPPLRPNAIELGKLSYFTLQLVL